VFVVTSGGSAYVRFKRALEIGNELLVLPAAQELPRIALDDALGMCLVLRDSDPDRNQRAAVRWLGRFAPPERIIVLPPLVLQALSMLARRTDSPYVFHTPRGRRLVRGSLYYLWRPVSAAWRAETGRDLDLHELRHACATLLLERGLSSADVALQLGHTDGGRLVQTLYGHPNERLARDRVKMVVRS
jgi:integrase